MVCKMLFFDYREEEKPFFKTYTNSNYSIKFFEEPLNADTVVNLSAEELKETAIISVFITSEISRSVIDKFENLRIISTRSSRYGHVDLRACVDNNIALVNVETYESHPINYVLSETFKGIMSVYCGDKRYRII